MIRNRPPWAPLLAVALALCALVLAACGAGSSSQPKPSSSSSGGSESTLSNVDVASGLGEVRAAIRKAASIKEVPSDLTPPLQEAQNDFEKLPTDHCDRPRRKDNELFGECAYGDPKGSKRMVLLGDSHAGMWSTSLDLVGQQAGWQMRAYVRAACPAPEITFYSQEDNAVNTGCDKFRADAIDAIVKSKPDLIVVTSATYLQTIAKQKYASASQWVTGLDKTLGKLKAAGARMVMLGDIPVLAQSAPECLAAHVKDVHACVTSRTKALNGVYHASEQQAAKANGADYIDPTSWMCSSDCYPIINDILVGRNQFHITATYAAWLSPVLRKALHLKASGSSQS